MPSRPRRKDERLEQVLRWLIAEYPPPFPVKLVFSKLTDSMAECYELDGDRRRCIYIALDPRRRLADQIQDLLHEYAHALTWPVTERQFDMQDEHPPTFWAAYGEVYTAFYDKDGCLFSSDY